MLAHASQPIHTQVSNEFVEKDPVVWDQADDAGVREAVDSLGSAAAGIEYLTVTTSASCLVALGANGQAVRNSILVSDTRSVEQAEILGALPAFAPVFESTWLKPSPDLMIPKMMWLAQTNQRRSRRRRPSSAPENLVLRLTGERVIDPSSALKFHYMLDEGAYSEPLMSALDIDPGLFPEVLPMGSDLGPITTVPRPTFWVSPGPAR